MPLAFLYSEAHLLIIGKMKVAPPAFRRLTSAPPPAAPFTPPSLLAASPLFFVPPDGGLLPPHPEAPRNAAASASITIRFMFHLLPSLRDPQISSFNGSK